MRIIDRKGNIISSEDKSGRLIGKMYSSPFSRSCLKLLTSPLVSRAVGYLLDSKISAGLVERYADKYNIDMFDYQEQEYSSFNDFFTRRLKKSRRIIDRSPNTLICPCDGKVTAYDIAKSDMFVIKNSVYSVSSLLRDRKLSEKYSGGQAIIIRLAPEDEHRYIYPCDGVKSRQRVISGRLNVLKPIANEFAPVYKENAREYCMIRSEKFGDIIMMEVGALMVGRINNFNIHSSPVKKGEEKGMFEFGGSTIVILLEKDKAAVCADISEATKQGYEMQLKLGEVIAEAML